MTMCRALFLMCRTQREKGLCLKTADGEDGLANRYLLWQINGVDDATGV